MEPITKAFVLTFTSGLVLYGAISGIAALQRRGPARVPSQTSIMLAHPPTPHSVNMAGNGRPTDYLKP